MKAIAFTNQKGGVGKTSLAFNLAHGLARRRFNVLAVDNDPQGNLTCSFLENPLSVQANILNWYQGETIVPHVISKNIHLIGADISLARVAEMAFDVVFALKEGIERLETEYDFIIIDCLPSFGHMHLASLIASNYALIPVKPSPYNLHGIKDLFDTIQKAKDRLNPPLEILGMVLNLVNSRGLVMEREIEEGLREAYSDLVFQAKLTKRVKIEESPGFQKSIFEYDPKGVPVAEFNKFIREFLKRLGE